MKTSIKLFTLALTATAAFSSCSDQFLQDKKNYDSASEDVYNYVSGATGRVNDVYWYCQPTENSSPGWKNPSTGSSDMLSQCTEEYSGFSSFNDPRNELTYLSGNNTVPDFFQGQTGNIQQSAWGRIRECNDVIRGLTNGNIPQEDKDRLLGQVYFWRAWCYYNFVKWYGGVPIIEEVQEPVAESQTPRSSTKACIDFICEDLDRARDLLINVEYGSGDYGRVTAGTAMALKGRVLLLWASPLFNRANDEQRWKDAYTFMKDEALPIIDGCGYGLANETYTVNAGNWATIFTPVNNDKSPEAVLVTLYNTIEPGGVPDYARNNGWEQGIRPSNTLGSGGKTPSEMIVSMFPMADGKRPSNTSAYSKLSASQYAYNQNAPFMNRDPRFYRTFAFPGVRWAFQGDPRISGGNMYPYNGQDYVLWNYVWYNKIEDRDNVESGNTFGSDALLGNAKGFYVRKRSDDLDVNSSPLYVYDRDDRRFGMSGMPWMELRYTEVLLNLAEAACGAGDMSKAVEILQRLRRRVGYTGDCGLDASLSSDQAACMSAILYERQIEFAYEGKRFDDLRRWLLYDGGAHFNEIEGAPSTWTLTGWGGNTCDWLGFAQLNGQRRENMVFRVNNNHNDGLGGTTYGTDPFDPSERCAAVDLRQEDLPNVEPDETETQVEGQ